jgi:vacuolar-type H+-ATPase subunit F/Vma7
MAAPVYLGDEVTGAGFRLAGVDARRVEAGEEIAALERARGQASLVLVSASLAARLPDGVLRFAIRDAPPVTLVVPDLRASTGFADAAPALRRQLGLES